MDRGERVTTKKLLRAMELLGQAQSLLLDTPNQAAHKAAADLNEVLHAIADVRGSLTGGKR